MRALTTRAAAAALLLHAAAAVVSVPAIFSDGMVLQCYNSYDQRPLIYGYADPGEVVALNRTDGSGNVQSFFATADTDGFWISQWNPDCSPNNFTVTIQGSASPSAITIRDVTYGDVFVCSGQSNMVFSVKSDFVGPEIAAQYYPNIRLFPIVQAPASTPQRDVPPYTGDGTPCWWPQNPRAAGSPYGCNKWQPAAPGITDEFSAACFFTALEMTKALPGRNIGLVYGAYDGTPMQAWSPPEALAKCPNNAAEKDAALRSPDTFTDSTGVTITPNDPQVLWNAMIAPVSRYAIRAVLWYQGESDSGDSSALFSCKFQALIESWRRRWRIGDFAWVFVQLAPQDQSRWPQYYMLNARLGQAGALPLPGDNTTDTTGMAPAYDLGDMGSPYPPSHVHPRNKTEVGRRLAAALLHVQYAYQWPAGGFNLTASTVNWRGPVGVSAQAASAGATLRGSAPSASTSYVVKFITLDGLGLYLANTADCWECCAKGQDTFQLSDAKGLSWVNTTIALAPGDNSSVIITPVTAGSFTQLRYAPNLWPQCAVYAHGNAFPAPPFILNISATAAPVVERTSESAAYNAPAVKVGSAIPLAVRGPNTWTQWKGIIIPPAADGILAATPPMGFNTWNSYHCNVDENIIRRVADAFVATGLAQLGYQYVNIDDCWQVDRNPNKTIIPDPTRFPSGMKAVADYVHRQGLKFGVYTAAHQFTCQSRPGSYTFEPIDAASYCQWGIDYLKIDGCRGNQWPQLNTSWILFKQGFDECVAAGGREIVMSVETCEASNSQGCQQWIPALANLWRTTSDIQANWGSVLYNLDNNNPLAHIAGPGHWNDPDMLQVGNPGLTFNEQKAHFSAWAIVAAPLLIGSDIVSGLDNATMSILSAPEVIAVNQDPLGVQGIRVSPSSPSGPECWAKPLEDGSVAAMLLNRGPASAPVTCTWQQIGLKDPSGAADVRDLWARSDLGSFTASYTATVESHDAVVVKVTQA